MAELATLVDQTRRNRYLRIIPVAFLMYTIAFMDRLNIGLALPSMEKALHFNSTLGGLSFGVFFLGYIVLQIPGGHLAERWSAKWFVFFALIAWGVFAVLTGFVQNVGQLLVVRFMLGICEGGVWPATLVLLAHWFPRGERARANNLWMLCLPVASVIASPISGWILATTDDYRLLFLYEGVPPLVWATIWAIVIRDRPRGVAWLSDPERDALDRTLAAERSDRDRPDLGTYRRALLSPATWLFCAIYFFNTIPGYGISSFLPSLLEKAGMPIEAVGIVTALPFAMAIIGLIVIGVLSDKAMVRRRHVALPFVWLGVGIILSALLSSIPVLSIVILVVAGFGLYAVLGPFWATVDQVVPAETSGGTMGFINGVGNLGGFVGPTIVGFLDTVTGTFVTGFVFLGLCALAMAVLAMQIRVREGEAATKAKVAAG